MLMFAAPSVRPSVNLGELVSTLNYNTSVKQTWQMLRRISGKRKDKTIKYLVIDSDTITNETEIADTLATTFAAKSSPDHYHERNRMRRKTHWTLSQIMTKSTMLLFQNENSLNLSLRQLIRQLAMMKFIAGF